MSLKEIISSNKIITVSENLQIIVNFVTLSNFEVNGKRSNCKKDNKNIMKLNSHSPVGCQVKSQFSKIFNLLSRKNRRCVLYERYVKHFINIFLVLEINVSSEPLKEKCQFLMNRCLLSPEQKYLQS